MLPLMAVIHGYPLRRCHFLKCETCAGLTINDSSRHERRVADNGIGGRFQPEAAHPTPP